MIFQNRTVAGEKLAKRLKSKIEGDAIVVGISLGGMVIAESMARILGIPSEVIITEKLIAPENPELGIGAISMDGDGIYNHNVITFLGISKEYLQKEKLLKKERAEQLFRKLTENRERIDFNDKHVIVVDEGVATGASIRAALAVLKKRKVRKITLAVPVGSSKSVADLKSEVDECLCLASPTFFQRVSDYYQEFDLP